MRTLVFGAGGVGGYFGARLAAAGADVMFIARGRHLDAITRHGLRVKSILGDLHLSDARATDVVPDDFSPELVLMCVKAWQLEDAARMLAPHLNESSTVLPLLNGIDAPSRLAAILGGERVVAGLCGIIAYVETPGVVRHAAVEPFIRFGETDNTQTDRIQHLLALFQRTEGFRASVAEDIQTALWMKLLFIASTSAIGAVTAAPMDVIREVSETRSLLHETMQEIVNVAAKRDDVELPEDAIDRTFKMVDALPAGSTTSMQRDLLEGRRSELESQLGTVVRIGRELDVPMPVCETVLAALLPRERRAQGVLEFE